MPIPAAGFQIPVFHPTGRERRNLPVYSRLCGSAGIPARSSNRRPPADLFHRHGGCTTGILRETSCAHLREEYSSGTLLETFQKADKSVNGRLPLGFRQFIEILFDLLFQVLFFFRCHRFSQLPACLYTETLQRYSKNRYSRHDCGYIVHGACKNVNQVFPPCCSRNFS